MMPLTHVCLGWVADSKVREVFLEEIILKFCSEGGEEGADRKVFR